MVSSRTRAQSAKPLKATEARLQPVCPGGKPFKFNAEDNLEVNGVLEIFKIVYLSFLTGFGLELPAQPKKGKGSLGSKDMINFVNSFSHYMREIGGRKTRGTAYSFKDWILPKCNIEVAKNITNMAYLFSVPNPNMLNSGKGSKTYGETSLDQMNSFAVQLKLTKQDVFFDLGSGIGQLVLFLAASQQIKKAVGIEIATAPAQIAKKQERYFRRLTSHFGKRTSSFSLFEGSFLEPKYVVMIATQATVIFINNKVFTPEIELFVMQLLSMCKTGTRIVSSERFVSQRDRNSKSRSQEDFAKISRERELESVKCNASWTSKTVQFYLTTICHEKA